MGVSRVVASVLMVLVTDRARMAVAEDGMQLEHIDSEGNVRHQMQVEA